MYQWVFRVGEGVAEDAAGHGRQRHGGQTEIGRHLEGSTIGRGEERRVRRPVADIVVVAPSGHVRPDRVDDVRRLQRAARLRRNRVARGKRGNYHQKKYYKIEFGFVEQVSYKPNRQVKEGYGFDIQSTGDLNGWQLMGEYRTMIKEAMDNYKAKEDA